MNWDLIQQTLNSHSNFFFQDEIKDYLDRVCTIIPIKEYIAKCRDAVKGEIGDQIIDLLLDNLDPNKICKILCWILEKNLRKTIVKNATNKGWMKFVFDVSVVALTMRTECLKLKLKVQMKKIGW